MKRYTVLALGLLAVADGLHLGAFVLLGPDIGATFGIGPATIGGLATAALAVTALAALPLASFAVRGRRRVPTVLGAGAGWAVASGASAIAPAPALLAATLALDGATTATVGALHPALLVDAHGPGERVRALSAYRSTATLGAVATPAVVLTGAAAGLTWRGTLLLAAGCSLLAVASASGLREPRPPAATAPEPSSAPAPGEATRRLLAVPALRRLLGAHAAAGAFLVPLGAYFAFFLEDRWALGAGGRAAVAGAVALAVIGTLGLFAAEGERLLGRRPSALIALTWRVFALGTVLVAASVYVGSFAAMVTLTAAASACFALVETAQVAVLLTLAPPALRAHAAALAACAFAGVGGIGGVFLLSGLDAELGLAGAIAALAVPGLVGAAVARSAGPLADRDAVDLQRPVAPAAGVLLELRDLAFGYDSRPVLDGVDVTIDRGEVVALTGANGAGKTTLLRLVAGLEQPRRGLVLLAGRDRTFATPEDRVQEGMAAVFGGRATFGSLTVAESLALTGSHAPLFPELEARLSVPARALSGGEQTLLGLAQALALRPRLLLLDELALGLSSEAAARVAEAVRALAAAGSAVLLVEQDESLGLGLASRAVHLEGGRVAYDGPPSGLRERGDLRVPVHLA